MDPNNRPRGREKHVTNNSTGVHKRGEGLGTGPVGSSNGYAGKTSGGNGGGKRAAGGGIGVLVLGAIAALVFGKLGGGNESSTSTSSPSSPSAYTSTVDNTQVSTSTSSVNTSVANGSRSKYTTIVGNGNDTVTLMVYICGTDLESKNGMATSDLSEMVAAKFGSNVNLIAYTGGCTKWQTQGISNSTNQIYQIVDGKIKRLENDMGSKVMTNPDTLTEFIKYCKKNFEATRYDLILWDHGGGSVSGYGYDEKNPRSGAMDLAEINKALKNGGVKFDFVGFDACLMATAETALMLNDHADYMVASEETEPGIGWYYTNWLTKLGSNTSMPTVEIGKNIIDDFVDQCGRQCRGQKTTLSIIDLAEFANTVPENLSNFAKSVSTQIQNNDYQTISDARYNTREFATSSKIDQIDLVDLCNKINSKESKALAKSLQSAVKYNKTSSNMTNAYGVSIFFPYNRKSYVDEACSTYDDIGMNDEYSDCIRAFAKLQACGQAAAGGSSSSSGSLFGSLLGGLSSSSSGGSMLGSLLGGLSGTTTTSSSSDVIGSLLGSFLSGSGSSLLSGLTGKNSNFLSDRSISTDYASEYIAMNHFDSNNLVWKKSKGKNILSLSEDQWKKVHAVDLNMFYDDGNGFVDLGLDNIYDWTDDGDLIASDDKTWIAINGQPVAYYHEDTTELGKGKYSISGRVPAMLNGNRVNIWLVFDNDHPYGYISGAQYDYKNLDTPNAVAKSMTALNVGDKLEFICDYYSYDGKYLDSYYLGKPMTVSSNMEISNVDVGSGNVLITYRFTDLYNQEYWTESLTF